MLHFQGGAILASYSMLNLRNCGFANQTLISTENMYFVTFYILLPYYLTLGLLSNIILLVAFIKQAKIEGHYAYQVSVVITKTFENVTFGLFLGGAYWFAGLAGDKAQWFISNYTLMHITMRILGPLHHIAIFLSLSISVAMSADRVFALWKPFIYKVINHRLHRNAALVACILSSIGLCVDYYWYYDILEDHITGFYTLSTNLGYVGTMTAQVLEGIRAPIRLVLVAVLIILNIFMLLIYRRRMHKLKRMSMSNQEKADARKETHTELIILTICQSCLTCLDQIPHSVMQVIRHQSELWARCGLVMAPVADGAIMVSDAMEFWIIFVVNHRIRANILEVMCIDRLWKRFMNWRNRVVPVQNIERY